MWQGVIENVLFLSLENFFTKYHNDMLTLSRWGSLCGVIVGHLHLVPGLRIQCDCLHGCMKSSAKITLVVITDVGLLEMVLSFNRIISWNCCWRNLLRTEIQWYCYCTHLSLASIWTPCCHLPVFTAEQGWVLLSYRQFWWQGEKSTPAWMTRQFPEGCYCADVRQVVS